ncbi:carboxymuconolactone decarboxylase family protein [Dickeya dadantii]|nr:carboxymuconolactone decarboxylase family protein [Dickeya dadantii]NPE71950.1 carboxymuconolactone decarboxylase family protein [Dickeya dadantii]
MLELLHLRITQINNCAYCIAMYIPIALEPDVSGDKVNRATAWKRQAFFRLESALRWPGRKPSPCRRNVRCRMRFMHKTTSNIPSKNWQPSRWLWWKSPVGMADMTH